MLGYMCSVYSLGGRSLLAVAARDDEAKSTRSAYND